MEPSIKSRITKPWIIALIVALIAVVGSVAILRSWYNVNLRPASSSTAAAYFTVNRGSGVHQIAVDLQAGGLIRSISAFETYVTASNYRDKLQAGTYKLSPSMSVQTIVNKMVKGDVAKDLLTIGPSKRLDQIKQTFRDNGYSQTEVDTAFNPANYAGHPALASLPAGATLEGYLYPDSFQKLTDTPAQFIVRESLDEMQKYLTNNITSGFKQQQLSTYQGITLASIVLKEYSSSKDETVIQPIVAQVLLARLSQNMPLQADATAIYGAIKDGVQLPQDTAKAAAVAIAHDSAYNTYLHNSLPPGPISNVTKEALQAAAHPATTDYLYYFTGNDCKMHFTKTAQEHQAAIEKYGVKTCTL